MHGRNLTGSIANVFPLDVFIRDNRHAYDAFIYGFQQEKSLSAEIMMNIQSTVELKMLFFLRSQVIHNTISAEVFSSLFKYIRTEIYNSASAKIDCCLLKHIRKEIINSLSALITVSLTKIISPNDLLFGFVIGTIDRGKVVADIENYFRRVSHSGQFSVVSKQKTSKIKALCIVLRCQLSTGNCQL